MNKDWLDVTKSAKELIKSIPLNDAKKELITIRVSSFEKDLLKEAAKRDRVSLSQFLINPALRKARL